MKLKPEKSWSLVVHKGHAIVEEPFTVDEETVNGVVVNGEVIPSLQRKSLRTLSGL